MHNNRNNIKKMYLTNVKALQYLQKWIKINKNFKI